MIRRRPRGRAVLDVGSDLSEIRDDPQGRRRRGEGPPAKSAADSESYAGARIWTCSEYPPRGAGALCDARRRVGDSPLSVTKFGQKIASSSKTNRERRR